MTWLHFLIAGTLVAVLALYMRGRVSRPSRQFVLDRTPDEALWARQYSEEDAAVVREARSAITDAFLLRGDDAGRLMPDDRLIDIYRAAYPDPEAPDALEFETLWDHMRDELRLPESELRGLSDMTVGQVADIWLRTRGAAQQRNAPDKARS